MTPQNLGIVALPNITDSSMVMNPHAQDLIVFLLNNQTHLHQAFGHSIESIIADEDENWTDMSPEISRKVELAFLLRETDVNYMIGQTPYRINFHRLVQINDLKTSLQRHVRRFIPNHESFLSKLFVPSNHLEYFGQIPHVECQALPSQGDCLILSLNQIVKRDPSLPFTKDLFMEILRTFHDKNMGGTLDPIIFETKVKEYPFVLVVALDTIESPKHTDMRTNTGYRFMKQAISFIKERNERVHLDQVIKTVILSPGVLETNNLHIRAAALAYSEYYTLTAFVRRKVYGEPY